MIYENYYQGPDTKLDFGFTRPFFGFIFHTDTRRVSLSVKVKPLTILAYPQWSAEVWRSI